MESRANYQRRRMAEEVALASATTCDVTRSAHLELAELHLIRLTALEEEGASDPSVRFSSQRVQAT
jgi:hypothetical protein